jgi:hypothetical protein
MIRLSLQSLLGRFRRHRERPWEELSEAERFQRLRDRR